MNENLKARLSFKKALETPKHDEIRNHMNSEGMAGLIQAVDVLENTDAMVSSFRSSKGVPRGCDGVPSIRQSGGNQGRRSLVEGPKLKVSVR